MTQAFNSFKVKWPVPGAHTSQTCRDMFWTHEIIEISAVILCLLCFGQNSIHSLLISVTLLASDSCVLLIEFTSQPDAQLSEAQTFNHTFIKRNYRRYR